jgi:hypothetical protein
MEMTAELIRRMVEHCVCDFRVGKFIQPKEKLLANQMAGINSKMVLILDYIATNMAATACSLR